MSLPALADNPSRRPPSTVLELVQQVGHQQWCQPLGIRSQLPLRWSFRLVACFGPLFVLSRGGTLRRFRFRGGRGRRLGGLGDYLTGLERSGEVLGPVAVRAAQDSYANVRLDAGAGRLAGEGGVHSGGAGYLERRRNLNFKEQFLKKNLNKKTSISN